jgi:hypothetical protein
MKDNDKVANYQTKLAYYFHVTEWKPDEHSTIAFAKKHLSRHIKDNWNDSNAPRTQADSFEELISNAHIVEAYIYAQSKKKSPTLAVTETAPPPKKSVAQHLTDATL